MPSKVQAEKRRRTRAAKRRRLFDVQVDEISLVDEPAVPGAKFVVMKRAETMSESQADDRSNAADETPVDGGIEKGGETEGTGDTEDVKVEKASKVWMAAIRTLRAGAGSMDPSGLEILANVMRYTISKYYDEESVRVELTKAGISDDEIQRLAFEGREAQVHKAMKVLGPTAYGKIESAAVDIVESGNGILKLTRSAKEIKKQEPDGEQQETETKKAGSGDGEEETGNAEGVAKGDEQKTTDASQTKPLSVLERASALLAKKQAERQAGQDRKVLDALNSLSGRLETIESRQAAFSEKLSAARGKVS